MGEGGSMAVVVVVDGMVVALVVVCNLFGGMLCNLDGLPMSF